jgi:hypothetical protein
LKELDESCSEVSRAYSVAQDETCRAFFSLVGNRRGWLRHQSERGSALIDLELAADRGDSFGSSCAHSAAVVIANQAWGAFWRAADPDGWRRAGEEPSAELEMDLEAIRPRVAEVCQALLRAPEASNWPELHRVIVATESEVSRAIRSRQLQPRLPAKEENTGKSKQDSAPAKKKGGEPKMIKHLHSDPESLNWSARKWGEFLGVQAGTVKGYMTWDNLVMTARKLRQAERAARGRA